MKNKRLILIIAGVLVTLSAYAASKQFNVSEMILGTGSGITRFIFRNGTDHEIRSNPATGKIEVTQDGLNFKTLGSGSGSGSGVNALQESNPNFEDGTGLWTASVPASFTSETTEQLFGVASGKFDPAASGETLDSAEIVLEKGFYGQRCQLAFKYKYTGSTGDYTVEVQDEADAAILKQDLLATEGDDIGNFAQSFPCGSGAGSALQVRIESTTDAGVLYIDSVFLGTGRSEIAIQQNQLYAAAYYPATTNCVWTKSGNTSSFENYDADTDCPSIVKTAGIGEVDTTDNNLPDIVLPNARKGTYRVTVQFVSFHSNISHTRRHKIISTELGASNAEDAKGYPSLENSNSASSGRIEAVFANPSQQNISFSIRVDNNSGDSFLDNQTFDTTYLVEFYPDTPSVAQTYDTEKGRNWEGIISNGGDSVALSTTGISQASVQTATASIINKQGGAKILCADGSLAASSCASSNEQVGIAFVPLETGTHRVCFNFTNFTAAENLGGIITRFYMAEMNNSQTIGTLTEAIAQVASYDNSSTSHQQGVPVDLCANIHAVAGVEKRVGLHYSVNGFSSGTTTANLLATNTTGTLGSRVLHFTVESKTHASSLPVFPEFKKKVSSSTSETFMEACSVNSSTSPTGISSRCSDWISSYSYVSAGRFRINFTEAFDEVPVCTCTPHYSTDGAVDEVCLGVLSAASPGSFEYFVYNGSTASAINGVQVNIVCVGEK